MITAQDNSRYLDLLRLARELGTKAGESAASWHTFVNVAAAEDTICRVNSDDPTIYDTFPTVGLSGGTSGGEDYIGYMLEGIGMTEDELEDDELTNDLCGAYELAATEAVEHTIMANAFAMVLPDMLTDLARQSREARGSLEAIIVEACDHLTQSDIGRYVGISQQRVSQILTAWSSHDRLRIDPT